MLFIDEADVIRSLPLANDAFFAAIRRYHIGYGSDTPEVLATGHDAGGVDPGRTDLPCSVGTRRAVRDITAQEEHRVNDFEQPAQITAILARDVRRLV